VITDPDFDMPGPTRVMAAGDWHGNWPWTQIMLHWAAKRACDAVVHVGDFGYWPAWDEWTRSQTGPSHYLTQVRALAKELGLVVYWVDGNHENHEALYPGQGDEVLRHLPRGHRWQWWGKTWMSVGGAVSVDKHMRTPGYDWFGREILDWEQAEYCCREGKVDVIISHDCPAGVAIPGIDMESGVRFWPQQVLVESEAHRGILATICHEVEPRLLIHGHYHRSYTGKTPDGKTIVIGLDCDATDIKKNGLILTKESFTW
jgi:Icc-related predicted phosphoesterase